MALKAYTLDLALQTSSEFAIGNTIPNVAGIATDGKGFIPTKNSINKTITLSKGFGKFGGRLFEMTEQTVYSWDSGYADADAYLVIDLTKQNSFKGTIEDGTYEFVDNQSSIVLSDTVPSPSANVLVYKLDGNYQNSQNRNFNQIEVSGKGSFDNLNVSGVVSSSNDHIEFDKPISTPVISGTAAMWYGWKVYYHVENGMVTYQFQATGSTIPSGTISNEKLPKAAIPLYKTFVPLAYGGQGFAINIDGSLENYTGVSISGASWASASSHVLNKW